MQRRWLRSIPISKGQRGAYASKWEGWKKAVQRKVKREELWRWNPTPITRLNDLDFKEYVPDYCGVYVFLDRNNYVLYVGKSKYLGTEILRKHKRLSNNKRKHIKKFVVHRTINDAQAKKMELDLIWYYVPPWNKRFHK